jgi:glycosyltransferase involved in cell wall biosynthesis
VARICLITTGQPSTNPRLLKEADALIEAGHEVDVICAHWARWADETDKELLRSRRFTCTYVGGHQKQSVARYGWTRLRHKAGRVLAPRLSNETTESWALCRVTPELSRAALTRKADLYIAHNLGALPAAVHAARRHSAKVGFDAEDFHSGMKPIDAAPSYESALTERIERRFLAACDYVTASSPLIARAYKSKYGNAEPTTILNVFPLAHRPHEFRVPRDGEPLTLYWFSQTIGANRGLEDVVRAMGILESREVQMHLRGDWQRGYREELYGLAARVGVKREQIVSHAPAHPYEMIKMAAQHDVGLALEEIVSENRDICLTNKIFTYLLAGNAVIATKTKAQQSFIDKSASVGRCYAPGDIVALAEILERWDDDRDDLENARLEAWRWGEERYNWELEKQKFLDLVEHALDSSGTCVSEISAYTRSVDVRVNQL